MSIRETLRPCGILAGAAAALLSSAALAVPTCEGSYVATVLHPLPDKVVIGLDIHDASPRNQKLAERFLAGVREAGVATGAQPTVLLHVSTSSLNDAIGGGASKAAEQRYSELGGIGGASPALPRIPDNRFATPRSAAPPAMLFLRIDATVGAESRIAWVASVQCQMIGNDEGQRAQELGRIIAGAVGKRVERKAI